MAALAAYIHGKGLKAGLYSSPGPLNCAGYTGSYQHEEIDAKTFAAWKFDFLKYDWCSYGEIAPKKPTLAEYRKPYDLMGGLLKKQDRDMVLNLCQYGMGEVWTWAEDIGGNSWRTCRVSTTSHWRTRAMQAMPAPVTGTTPIIF
jgi:alpha-galactosidase